MKCTLPNKPSIGVVLYQQSFYVRNVAVDGLPKIALDMSLKVSWHLIFHDQCKDTFYHKLNCMEFYSGDVFASN